MVVTGGLTWWKDFICVACYNIPDQRDEVCLIFFHFILHQTPFSSFATEQSVEVVNYYY